MRDASTPLLPALSTRARSYVRTCCAVSSCDSSPDRQPPRSGSCFFPVLLGPWTSPCPYCLDLFLHPAAPPLPSLLLPVSRVLSPQPRTGSPCLTGLGSCFAPVLETSSSCPGPSRRLDISARPGCPHSRRCFDASLHFSPAPRPRSVSASGIWLPPPRRHLRYRYVLGVQPRTLGRTNYFQGKFFVLIQKLSKLGVQPRTLGRTNFQGKFFVLIQKLSKLLGPRDTCFRGARRGDQWAGHPGQVTVGQPQADGGRSADPRAPAGARRRVY